MDIASSTKAAEFIKTGLGERNYLCKVICDSPISCKVIGYMRLELDKQSNDLYINQLPIKYISSYL